MEEIQHNYSLPRSGRPAKIIPRARRIIFQEVTKNPRVTSKDLQVSLALTNVSVNESTIRQTLNKHGVHGRIARRNQHLPRSTCMDVPFGVLQKPGYLAIS